MTEHRDPSPSDLTNDQLAAQAKAAADQALQLAKLAEESARLAQHLNQQVLSRSGQSLPEQPLPVSQTPAVRETPTAEAAPVEAAPVDAGEAPIIATGDHEDRVKQAIGRRGRSRKKSRSSPREDFERRSMRQASAPVTARVRIKSNPEDLERDSSPIKEVLRSWKGVLISTAIHLGVLFVLGLLTFAIQGENPINTVIASFAEDEKPVEEEIPIEEPVEEEGEQMEEPEPEETEPEEEPAEEMPEPEKMEVAEEPPPMTPGPEPAATESAVDLAKIGARSDPGKAMLLKKYGGSAASESAVSRSLDWFVSVQRRDGSWNFNDIGPSANAGDADNPMGATSYVVLAFLGAGQTHQKGKYKANVSRAINFLVSHARRVPAGVDMRGPNPKEHNNFYVQGPAAMALSEAYGMTRDRRLIVPAQGAINFICFAQDPQGGGWRYEPRTAGCTSVTTLQLTALISAQRSGLKVPPQVLEGVRHFYTTVKCDAEPNGRFAYRAEEPAYKAASTAEATLGLMYLGSGKDDPEVQAAIDILDDRGPYSNRYYCYYATQVMKNAGGPKWDRWNESLRDELVNTQISKAGPAFGSWTPLQRGGSDVAGGRLFITALSTMTLEVYYRYLPLYDSFEVPPDNEEPEKDDKLITQETSATDD